MNGVKTVELNNLSPRIWEYEGYLRRSAVAHLMTASNTLQSLIKLLGEVIMIEKRKECERSIIFLSSFL